MSLENVIALVSGASRGAGRAIALELALDGATVFITGRSRVGDSTTQYDDLTLDHTVALIEEAGGKAVAITCDHTNDEQNKLVVEEIKRKAGRIDILVNNVWGGYMGQQGDLDITSEPFTAPFWEQPVWRFDRMYQAGVRAHYMMSRLVAPVMIKQETGLIINTSFWDDWKYTAPVSYDLAKLGVVRMVYGMAIELEKYNIATIALSLGWIRTEHLNRSHGGNDYLENEEMLSTESPRYAGRAVVALASDIDIMKKTGKVYTTGELAQEYDFDDIDGRRPGRFIIPDAANGRTQRDN